MHIAGDVIVVVCMALAAWAVVSVVSAAMDRAAVQPAIPDHLHFTRLCIIEHDPLNDKPYTVWCKADWGQTGFTCRTKSEAQQLVLSLEHDNPA